MNELESKIEALLLFAGTSTVSEAASLTGESVEAVSAACDALRARLETEQSGIRLVTHEGEIALATAPEHNALIESMRRAEIDGPLGRAGLETLAIIIYRGPSTRADIEYIRGVNSQTTLRSLMMRGLIARTEKPSDKRSYIYAVTKDVPAFLGVSNIESLPEYAEVRARIAETLAQKPAEEAVTTI